MESSEPVESFFKQTKRENQKNPMNWEETILHFQSRKECHEMMLNTYLDSDLIGNATRFMNSQEFSSTLGLIKEFHSAGVKLADIGAGTGIASVAFAKADFDVFAVEPDPSEITGRGAIAQLKTHYGLENLKIQEGRGEQLPFSDNTIDIVYIRQAVHHADNLSRFAMECLRVLKPGGLLIAVREHVVLGRKDKKRFLETHPMHSYYGGENAYTLDEYVVNFQRAGAQTVRILRHFDSPINYFPRTSEEIQQLPELIDQQMEKRSKELFGSLGSTRIVQALYKTYIHLRTGGPFDERRIPGRMYSFLFRKNK
jgi:ubiquinone/menaquinone biosynthesis C-methylase UbiE